MWLRVVAPVSDEYCLPKRCAGPGLRSVDELERQPTRSRCLDSARPRRQRTTPVRVQERGERTQHVLDVEIGERADVVEAHLLHRDAVLLARLVVIRRADGHQGRRAGQERQPRDDVVAPAAAELVGSGATPEQLGRAVGRQLEGVHVHPRPRVPPDLLAQLRGEHDRVPVVDDRIDAVPVEVVDGVVDGCRGRGRLTRTVHPEDEEPPVARVGRRPRQRIALHQAGEVDDGSGVQDCTRRRRVDHARGHGRDEVLAA